MGEQNPTGFRVSRCSPGMTGGWSSSFQRKLESKSKAKIGNFVSEKYVKNLDVCEPSLCKGC